jgi:predicted kinase
MPVLWDAATALTYNRSVRRSRPLQTVIDSLGALPEATARPFIVLTVGLPASGKSTFARRLAPEAGAAVLESDALRRLIFGRPVYSARESRQLFAALHGAARDLIGRGVPVIIDATSLKERDRLPVCAIADDTGVPLLIVRLTAPESVILWRMAQRTARPDPDDRSEAGIEVYYRYARGEEPLSREHWLIDTSDAAAYEAAFEQIVAACRLVRVQASQLVGGTV